MSSSSNSGSAAKYLINVWGVLSFLLILPPLFMLLPGVYQMANEALQPIASVRVGAPIALICNFVIAFYMLTLRDDLRRYSHTRMFGERPGRPLPIWGLLLFVAAILCAFVLAFGLTDKSSIIGYGEGRIAEGSFGHMVIKLLMTGVFLFVFVFLALSAGLMAAYSYTQTMDESSAEKPLYASESKLQSQTFQTACAELGLDGKQTVISDMRRTAGGGLRLMLQSRGTVVQGENSFREDRTWQAEADDEGRLIKVEQVKSQVTKVEEPKSPAKPSQLADVLETLQKLMGAKKLVLSSMERANDGSVSMQVSHEDKTISIRVDQRGQIVQIG